MRHYHIQLANSVNMAAIIASGGIAYVAAAGGSSKVHLLDADGAALSNPISLVRGALDFYVADSVPSVDLYIQAPSGHFLVEKSVVASGPNTLYVDKGRSQTVYVIPFSSVDAVDATEFDTGFDLPTNALVLPAGVSVDVTNAAATETLEVGLLAAEVGGDLDGFMDAIAIGTAATVVATLTQGAATLGVLLSVQDSANAGDLVPEPHVCDGVAKSISYTMTAGTDAAVGEGFIKLPVQLPVASL